jgi:GNAT superfamily N-acetyltransferase
MLTYAARMDPGGAASIPEARENAYLASYVAGFGREGDFGVLAIDESGTAVGAAWARLRPGPHPYEATRPDEPELAIAVLPDRRDHGVGRLLLDGLIAQARAGHPALVLSVRADSRAVKLYEDVGFVVIDKVTSRVGTPSLVMRLSF